MKNKKNQNKNEYRDYFKANNVTPEVFAVFFLIATTNVRVPAIIVERHSSAVAEAVELGFLSEYKKALYPTYKAKEFVQGLLALAKANGEISSN